MKKIVSFMMCLCCLITTTEFYQIGNSIAVSAVNDVQTFQDWSYIINETGNITITDYNGNDTDITIPN